MINVRSPTESYRTADGLELLLCSLLPTVDCWSVCKAWRTTSNFRVSGHDASAIVNFKFEGVPWFLVDNGSRPGRPQCPSGDGDSAKGAVRHDEPRRSRR
jgi:hypothetical protein